MNASWKNRVALAGIAALALAALLVAVAWQPAQAGRGGSPGPFPRYSVLDSEGHNLIVTDNKTDTLYFYTIDKDARIGSDLKLRGTLDLKQVGKSTIRPTKTKHEK
jgi:hypothetical protein